jgi:hypothetical protein
MSIIIDYLYAIGLYLKGIWDWLFSYSSDNTNDSVFRFIQMPILSHSIGGLPVYSYLLMFFTIIILAAVTIMEKGVIPGVTAPPDAKPSPPEPAPSLLPSLTGPAKEEEAAAPPVEEASEPPAPPSEEEEPKPVGGRRRRRSSRNRSNKRGKSNSRGRKQRK